MRLEHLLSGARKKDDVKEITEDKRQTLSYFSQKVLFRYKEKDEAETYIIPYSDLTLLMILGD